MEGIRQFGRRPLPALRRLVSRCRDSGAMLRPGEFEDSAKAIRLIGAVAAWFGVMCFHIGNLIAQKETG
ncbi:MAG: hypothetical protein WAN59_15145 [Candidatus Baltobacteraceae bacterium]